MRFVLIALLIFAACAREERQPPRQHEEKAVTDTLRSRNADYELKWSVTRDDKVLISNEVSARIKSGAFYFLMKKESDTPEIHLVHSIEVFRTKKDLFTRVDGSTPIRWSSFVHEDRDLWNLAFGDLELALRAFGSCYFFMDNRVKMSRGECRPDFSAGGLSARELKSLWTGAEHRGFSISGSRTAKGLWKKLSISIVIDDMTLAMSLEGTPAGKSGIKGPEKWVQDKSQRPWAMLQQLKRAIGQGDKK